MSYELVALLFAWAQML